MHVCVVRNPDAFRKLLSRTFRPAAVVNVEVVASSSQRNMERMEAMLASLPSIDIKSSSGSANELRSLVSGAMLEERACEGA